MRKISKRNSNILFFAKEENWDISWRHDVSWGVDISSCDGACRGGGGFMRSGECGLRIESDNMEHGSHHSRASGTTSTRYRDHDHPWAAVVSQVSERKKTGALCEICIFFCACLNKIIPTLTVIFRHHPWSGFKFSNVTSSRKNYRCFFFGFLSSRERVRYKSGKIIFLSK